jgi:hypothetical protein
VKQHSPSHDFMGTMNKNTVTKAYVAFGLTNDIWNIQMQGLSALYG